MIAGDGPSAGCEQTADSGQREPDAADGERLPKRSANQAVRPDRKVAGVIDLAALTRGHLVNGDTCEIAGVGPVSLSSLRTMLSDAFITVVIRDGIDIKSVTHLGRQVTAHQRTALEARGYQCEVEGCGATHRLEIDHIEGCTLTHNTRLDDLAGLCRADHDYKNHHNLILVGPPGRRRLVPRDRARENSAGADPPGDTSVDPSTEQTALNL